MFYTQAPKTGGPHTRRGQVRRPPAQHRTAPEPRCPQLTGPGTLPLLPPPPPHEQGVGCTMLGAPSRCGVQADFHGTYVREPPAYPNSYVPRAGTTLALEGIAVATVVAASLVGLYSRRAKLSNHAVYGLLLRLLLTHPRQFHWSWGTACARGGTGSSGARESAKHKGRCLTKPGLGATSYLPATHSATKPYSRA